MSSSKSSESRDSLNSFPPDDRMPQSSSEILYEPLESGNQVLKFLFSLFAILR